MKYSKDGLVKFDENRHIYKLGEKTLTSVTQYISKYKPVFESDLIAEKYANKHGLNKQDVLNLWNKKAIESCEIGTFVHKIFEDYILGNKILLNDKYLKCNTAIKFIEDFFENERLIPVETEYIVYNDELAGQIDCIAKNKLNEYFILDWKTNNDIKYSNQWQNMIGIYNHLSNCSFNHYSIQLGIYKKLCKEYNIKDCFIVHLKDLDYDIIKIDKNIFK